MWVGAAEEEEEGGGGGGVGQYFTASSPRACAARSTCGGGKGGVAAHVTSVGGKGDTCKSQAGLKRHLHLHGADEQVRERNCPEVTRRTSHVTRHTSYVTRHMSHVTRHTSPITRHTHSRRPPAAAPTKQVPPPSFKKAWCRKSREPSNPCIMARLASLRGVRA